MEELNLTKEESEALYRIFCGLSSSCYDRAEVYDEAKPNMQLVYKKIIAWGKENNVDSRGSDIHNYYEKLSKEQDEFLNDYNIKHKYCPVCGFEICRTNLVAFRLDLNNKEDYKDLNTCVCVRCGSRHKRHDRKSSIITPQK